MSGYVIRHDRRIEVETLETGVKSRRVEPFVRVPLTWAEKAAKATKTKKALVWIDLLYLSWKTKSTAFSVSNQRRLDGVTRYTKYRALRELEAEGLITVTRHGKKAPLVTLIR